MNALSGCRVLLLEDEFFVADDIGQALALAGAQILGPFTRHVEALQAIEGGLAIDLGVLDINLQGEVSFAVADRLKAQGIPFVFSTGYGETSIPEAHQQAPRWEKPFRPEALAEAMASMTGRSANNDR
jgi:CheY-like chemotaxis protein